MVGPEHVALDERAAHELHRRRRREHVVDPPADVLRAHAEALAPPRIMRAGRLERAERVDPARADPAVELGALLGQEAAVLHVLLRPREIELAMRGVEIAHHEHALAGAAQLLRSEEHTSELQSQSNLVCRLLLEKKNKQEKTKMA